MYIEIDPLMSYKLIPYLLKILNGHAETITEDRFFFICGKEEVREKKNNMYIRFKIYFAF